MESLLVDTIPSGDNWQYEPKWDGFRALIFRDGEDVEIRSRSGQPLARYFPELVEAVEKIKANRFVLDGEIVIPTDDGGLSFDALLQRIHPAESRIQKLAHETPARLIVFDQLVERGKPLIRLSLRDRREHLEKFYRANLKHDKHFLLSPATSDRAAAQRWLSQAGSALDGVIAKRTELPYQSGNREGMVKIKRMRTADCVIGGFRYASKGKLVGSLLLGLYNEHGLLDHVGFCSTIKREELPAVTKKLEKLVKPPGFTGQAPGGPSRWSTKRSTEWEPLDPKLVVEVRYDHFTGGRFRHGTKLLRWRPEKAPRQCTIKQVQRESATMDKLVA
jgi:ATP-dependent DNA ligase